MLCHLFFSARLCAVTLELLLEAHSAHMWCFETFVRLHERSSSQMLTSSSCKWCQFTVLAVCSWNIKNSIILLFVSDNEGHGVLLQLNTSKTNKQTETTKLPCFFLFRNPIQLKVKTYYIVVILKKLEIVLMFQRYIIRM